MDATGQTIMTVVVLVLAALGLAYAYARTHQEFRARNAVEYAILALLMLASTIAILTTVGIVLSMLFETFNFFELYPGGSSSSASNGARASRAGPTSV
jgi:phosphate transport system permease protein